MEAISSKHLITSLLLILASSFTAHSANNANGTETPYQEASTVFIRTSCNSTTYPRLCYSSLVKHADLIQTNRVLLTGTALNVTLASAKMTSAMISALAKSRGLKPREVAAMKDCVEELSDSVDELRRSIGEMGRLGPSNFELIMSDVQTWVSAALTDESTCTDGFQESAIATSADSADVKTTVRGRIVVVAQLTSNALALINQLANSHG
ncbi:21 kDa protein-like [Abrus precatorius]|uniref:21 kDa protein-like n=1 Tax=Abrus precatorius TaxID=3816 RepID=A0A8B8LF77_ABRPR|nr:21 kDa protein-like [Abrus precatorius]